MINVSAGQLLTLILLISGCAFDPIHYGPFHLYYIEGELPELDIDDGMEDCKFGSNINNLSLEDITLKCEWPFEF